MQGGYFVPLMIEHPVDKEQLRRLAREHLNEFVLENMSELRSSVPKAVVLGEPFEEIIRYANQEKVDLIVIGTHGRTALASILLGSVAEKVISRAPCAVLSVRHPEYKFKES
jgi:nucleotide-binding universal stress UspA family protein